MAKNNPYDSSRDEDNDELWDQKYEEWKNHVWNVWLSENLVFPFELKRMEDLNSNPFFDNDDETFSFRHTMKVLTIEDEDADYSILVKVREGRQSGVVPLCDVEVTSRQDQNFWPVREYVVWFANRDE
jgi:hypothetical protein